MISRLVRRLTNQPCFGDQLVVCCTDRGATASLVECSSDICFQALIQAHLAALFAQGGILSGKAVKFRFVLLPLVGRLVADHTQRITVVHLCLVEPKAAVLLEV